MSLPALIRPTHLLLLLLPLATGCSGIGGKRAAMTPEVQTITSIGDRPLPVENGPPGSAVAAHQAEPGREASDEGRISGRVVDVRGRPVPNARVRVAVGGAAGGRVVRATTDPSGGFTLRGLRPGSSYTLIAESEDTLGVAMGRTQAQAPESSVRICLDGLEDVPTRRVDTVSSREEDDDRDTESPEFDSEASTLRINDEDLPPSADAIESDNLASRRPPMPRLSAPVQGSRWHSGGASGESHAPFDNPDDGSAEDRAARASHPPTSGPDPVPDRAPIRTPPVNFTPDEETTNPLPPAIEPGEARSPSRPGAIREAPSNLANFGIAPDTLDEAIPGTEDAAQRTFEDTKVPSTPSEPRSKRPKPAPKAVEPEPSPVPPVPTPEPMSDALAPPPPPETGPVGGFDLDPIAPAPVPGPGPDGPSSPSPLEETPAEVAKETVPPPTLPELDPKPAEPPREAESPFEAAPFEFPPEPAPDLLPDASGSSTSMNVETPAVPDRAPVVVDDAQLAASVSPAGLSPDRPSWGDIAGKQEPVELAEARAIATQPEAAPMPEPDPSRTAQADALRDRVRRVDNRSEALEKSRFSLRGAPADAEVGKASCQYDAKRRQIIDFSLPGLDGQSVRFQDLDADLVLIDFWGTWCSYCVESIPHLVELQRELGPKLKVVGVAYEQGSPSERAAKVAETARQLGINYTMLLGGLDGSCPLQAALHVQTYPTMVLVDRTGRVLWRDTGATTTTLARLDRVIASASQAETVRR